MALYEQFGGRLKEEGASFSVWAPHATSVSVVGDFNGWEGSPMSPLDGIWELFVPDAQEGAAYMFEVTGPKGETVRKADPFALYAQQRPLHGSVLFDVDRHQWQDHGWQRRSADHRPLNIYEVHLGSWKKGEDYRSVAPKLADHCLEMGFTHVELLPLTEHPLDESWGYQVTGYFAVTSRYGTPEDFQWFVDLLHQKGIGVILDWVPGHFPTDSHGLTLFDGTPLYEDAEQGLHPDWTTHTFDFSRPEVVDFLLSSAQFWCDKMHIDGLRIDGVSSMLRLDFGRQEGEWTPNASGGYENLAAIAFLKRLNKTLHTQFPGVMVIAEESHAFPQVTYPQGLGFDMKWNMGWMNDTLHYFSQPLEQRSQHHRDLTFPRVYAFSERYVLPLSQDEVVHLKKSLLGKQPGFPYAGLRLLRSYQMCQSGKKLIFMGGEVGQPEEWSEKGEVPWDLLDDPAHKGVQKMFADLNHLYLKTPALWERDFDPAGFVWIDCEDAERAVLSYRRKGFASQVVCVHNFSAHHYPRYVVQYGAESLNEIFNSDAREYGGGGRLNSHTETIRNHEGSPIAFVIDLPPLTTCIFEL